MKKSFFTFISVLLMLTIAVSSTALISATAEEPSDDNYVWSEETPFIRYEDAEGIRYIGPVGNLKHEDNQAEKPEDKASKITKGELAGPNTGSLPDAVDLSETKYFPPIGSQGGLGSCATFSTTYYQLSYEMNKLKDVAATAENTLSPQLVFNLMSTDVVSGTVADFNYDFLAVHGAPSMGKLPYTDSDRLSWYPSAEIWRDALDNRVDEFFTIENVGGQDTQITSADDNDLNELKYVLSSGHPIVYGTCIYSWVIDKIVAHKDAPENNKFLGEEIVKYQDGHDGGHSMIIVGYNDNIWVDQNSNGNVDEGEKGAFKICNSWGEGYANGGFCWVAYDALNEKTAVDGGFAGSGRAVALESFKWITVKPYDVGSKIYVRFTLNTQDRVQMNVEFNAEHNGVEETGRFLAGASYRYEGNELGFFGTTDADDGTFCYALDNVSPELCADNFDKYCFSATFEDTKADGKALTVKKIEIVNEHTGKVYPMSLEPFSLDGEKKTVLVKDAETTDKTVYYIGFDEPMLNFKTGDGDFTSVKMEYTEDRLGHNYRYVIEDAAEDVTLYFTDENGNKDDNNGEYFIASDRLNFYRTKNAHEALAVTGFEYEYGMPDINKRSDFAPVVVGGYEPYVFQYTIEHIETGETKFYDFDYKYDKSHYFLKEGKYKFTIDVRDQTGDIASYEEVIDIINRPFVFTELTAKSEYGDACYVGENVNLHAVTDFEKIISRGPQKSLYEFVIKDSSGNVCYTETVKSYWHHLTYCVSKISLDWIPEKKGTYTVTVSSTDGAKDYAEKTVEFTVFDSIYGDADGNGEVNVKDATAIQKSLAGVGQEITFRRDLADCDKNNAVTIKDATCIRKFIANVDNSYEAGKVIEYIPPYTEPETTVPATEPVTQPPVPEVRKVTFTNSHRWSGINLYCYYWSDTNKSMTTWPGVAMTNIGTNDFGEVCYTFDVPQGATYIIFTNGSSQTVDIPYSGGEAKFYPLTETDSQGHYKVANW